MAYPVSRPVPYNIMARHGGKPKPIPVRVASIAERKNPRAVRPFAKKGAILEKPRRPHENIPGAPRQVFVGQKAPEPSPAQSRAVRVARAAEKVRNNRAKRPGVIRPRERNPKILAAGGTYTPSKIGALKNKGVGRVLIMVACGPSINEVNLALLKDHPKIDIMSINKPDQRLWPTTYWAFCDLSQYNRNKELWAVYNGTIINSASIKVNHGRQVLIKSRTGHGFSRDLLNGFYIGRSTTYANMQTALYMNYDRVYIFGCDMGSVNGKMHYYGKNPDVDDKNRESRFSKEAEHYQHAANTLTEPERKKFYFCSTYNKWAFTKAFPSRDHTTVIPEILAYANSI